MLFRSTLGQNLGQTVQVTSGLGAGDRLVNNPPAGVLEGQPVQPVTPVAGYARAKRMPAKSEPATAPASQNGRSVTP